MTVTVQRSIRDLVDHTGWAVHPIRPQSKAPYLTDWPNRASTNSQDVENWAQTYPQANWAIVTGVRSGVFVVDVDPRNGGDASLASLEAQHGALPKTVTVETGGGGRHYYFRVPAGLQRCPKSIATGIDIKGDGGYVIAPPSVHPSGGEYRWADELSPWDVEIKEAPEWLVGLLARPAPSQSSVTPALGAIPEGQRDNQLFAEGRRLVSMGWTEDNVLNALLQRNQSACKPPLSVEEVGRIAAQAMKYPSRAQVALGVTDTDNAKRLVRRHGAKIRNVRGDRGDTWYAFDGHKWIMGAAAQNMVLQFAEETARHIGVEASEEPDQERAKLLFEHARQSLNRARLTNMVDLAKHQPEIAVSADSFNGDDYLLNCENGTYDLRAHVLRPHDSADLISRSTGYDFDAGATCPRWKRFVEEIFNGDQELVRWVQCFLGMSLTGYTGHQFVVFMTGRGSNGKSVLLETFTKVLGTYAGKCNNALFRTTQNDNEKGYILGRLRDVRFAYASELNEGEALASATIKEITGGETLSAREMYVGYCDMVPKFKLAMATNSLPRIDETNDGTWRRVRVVPFEVQFKPKDEAKLGDPVRDDGLKDYLVANELAGILNWCVQGLMVAQGNSMQMPTSRAITAATKAYRQDEDLLAEWLDDDCEFAQQFTESPTSLLNSFRESSGYKNFGSKKFRSLMEAKGYRASKSNGRRVYRGLRLKSRFI